MTKDEVLEAFPIGSVVKKKNGSTFRGPRGETRAALVAGVYGYEVAFIGRRYNIEVCDEFGRSQGEFASDKLERA